MELRHIRYFLAVAEELSFTRAAEKLLIAQPPLSRQIQDLEKELGAKLFIRNPRSLQLTEEGHLFKQHARQILSLVDKSTEEVREAKRGLSGMVYLGSVEGRGPRLLSQWIAGFQKHFPHVQYSLWNGNSDDVTDRLMQGLCDLAIIMEPYNAEGLNALRVHQEPWIAMLPAHHPLAREDTATIRLDQLRNQELILPSRRSRIREIQSWFGGEAHSPVIRCEMAHMMNAYELTEQGVGIAIYPASAAMMARSGKIVTRQIVEPSFTARYVLIWKKDRRLSHVSQKFLEYIQGELAARSEH